MNGARNSKDIAILIPAFNSEGTLEGTIRSILALKADLEKYIALVMLCDDGSSDHTIALAVRSWNNIEVPLIVRRSRQNRGEYRNVNSGIEAMPGHIAWVMLMHADNEPLPQWIGVLASECARVPTNVASICGSWMYVVDGKVIDSGDQRGAHFVEDVIGERDAVRRSILKGCWWHNGASAIRVEAWKEVGGHPQDTPLLGPLAILGIHSSVLPSTQKLRVKGDWDTMLRILARGYTIRYVGTPLIRYIETRASVSSGSFSWHGDVLETLQVMRRHQSVLYFGDILKMHGKAAWTLFRRFGGAVVRRHWRRAWFALAALPTTVASLLASSNLFFRGEGGRL